MKIIIILCILCSYSLGCYAGGRVGWNEISQLSFQDGNLMIHASDGAWDNPNECQNSVAILLKESDPNFDRAYSLILSAYMAGKSIRAWSDGCHVFDGTAFSHIRGFKYLEVK